jgi:hypothetical protein
VPVHATLEVLARRSGRTEANLSRISRQGYRRKRSGRGAGRTAGGGAAEAIGAPGQSASGFSVQKRRDCMKKDCFRPVPGSEPYPPSSDGEAKRYGGDPPGGALHNYLPGRRARIRRRQCFALLRVISNQVRNVRARLRDFVVQHAPQNVAPNRTRHREANRNCRHLVPGQAVFQVFPDLFFGHNTFLLQYSTAISQASFVQNLAKFCHTSIRI